MNSGDSQLTVDPRREPGTNYAASGRIMLIAMVTLFFVILAMILLHLYARWRLLRIRRRQLLRRARNRRTHLIFHVETNNISSVSGTGLDPAVLLTIPVFSFTGELQQDSVECAVCLSEFEDGENCRLMPRCGHCFHTECIDMWFQSQSTCPLCRSGLEHEVKVEEPVEVIIAVGEPWEGSEPGSSDTKAEAEDECGGDESAPDQAAFRLPVSRMLSFNRILSRERRRGGATESDSERVNG